MLSDSNYVRQPSQRLEPQKTVFVGALHGMMTAEGLAHVMNDLFDNVVYAGIDTDKHKYPIGKVLNCFVPQFSYWVTGIRGLMRGMATLPQGKQELLVVTDKVGRPQVSLG